MEQQTIRTFQSTFLTWYDQNRRVLPWRENPQPYYVWLSEIMLQQTQVQTVLPYFERFIQTFPDLASLAAAPDDVLMKCWEGLGYYARARNLKRAAQQIMTDYNGQFPQTATALLDIIGIGPYTAGAVASIAFNEVVPAVDGNAYRVFSRIFNDQTDISQSKASQHFRTLIQPLIPKDRPGDFNQAVMDLGASVCTTKEPLCLFCPLQAFCQSYAQGTMLDLPVKKKKIKKQKVQLVAVAVRNEAGAYLLQQRPKTGLLAGLSTFPLIDQADLPEDLDLTQGVLRYFKQHYNLALQQIQLAPVKPVTHIFTHLHWTLTLVTADLSESSDLAYFSGAFKQPAEFAKLALPTLQKKLWTRLSQA
ncbi:A/G-specific adenine glycosylase [Agrilactobacillus yilanensis]|uniref:Adenine DNA glycosylase n=1 Tax=Agrilactobacillus yilanensis TaxID=2485997 RepID=A0ABW4JCW3_9LACO|nr:A/G-specific adenine glycosylase [Agrilactobacillus yilanensis]